MATSQSAMNESTPFPLLDRTRRAAPSGGGKGGIETQVPAFDIDLPLHQRPAEALRAALEVFAQTGHWVAFYRSVLGPEGVASQLFPSLEEQLYFAGTREYDELQKMLTALRTSDCEKAESVESLSMITIRIPRSMQTSLNEEARQHQTSVNKLCISKLLVPVNPQYVPTQRGRVRGRKPRKRNP